MSQVWRSPMFLNRSMSRFANTESGSIHRFSVGQIYPSKLNSHFQLQPYLYFPARLPRHHHPDQALDNCLGALDSSFWSTACVDPSGLVTFRHSWNRYQTTRRAPRQVYVARQEACGGDQMLDHGERNTPGPKSGCYQYPDKGKKGYVP